MAKILVVEDNEAQQFLYQEELNEEGYEVVLAKNGKEAYPEYRNQFIALLADAFVVKSSDLSLLKKTVKDLLEKKK